jgi:hypothetical protein
MKFTDAPFWHRLFDRVGAGTSLLCAVHCAAVPLVMAFIPALTLALYQFGSPLHGVAQWLLLSHSFERAFAAIALSLCAVSLWVGVRRHGQWRWFAPWWLALVLFALGTLTPLALIPFWHGVLLAGGGIAIAWAHLGNARSQRCIDGQVRRHGPVMATLNPGS